MSEFSSRSPGLILLLFLGMLAVWPARAEYDMQAQAVIDRITDVDRLVAVTDRDDWYTGEVLAVVSQNARHGVIGFVEVVGLSPVELPETAATASGDASAAPPALRELRLELRRQSRKSFIQPGDFVRRLDLTAANPVYVGTTDLVVRESQLNVSSRYRPLVYQGLAIGDTAQTLYKNEFLVNYIGNLYYGWTDWLTVGSLVPANVLGRPNLNFRARVYDSDTTTLATGFSFVRLMKEKQASLNFNFYWDSTSSDSLISHTFVGIGLATWDGAADAAALKYLTSNSFQSGYEVILGNWDRFLIGPNYNFEKKALGGYLSYVWTLDRFHLQLSLNTTDITSLRLDPTDGYYGFFDMYWRF